MWLAFSDCPCGSGQPSVAVLVGVASLQWVYCGSGQPSVGVLVGMASLLWVCMAKRSGGRELGKGVGQAILVGIGFSRLSVESPPEGPGEGTGGARKGGEGATWTGLFDADTPGARPAEQCSATCKIQ